MSSFYSVYFFDFLQVFVDLGYVCTTAGIILSQNFRHPLLYLWPVTPICVIK